MGCIDSSGELTPSAARMLRALQDGAAPADVAQRTGLSLPRVRSGLRELATAGLAEEHGDRYRRTPAGDAALSTPVY